MHCHGKQLKKIVEWSWEKKYIVYILTGISFKRHVMWHCCITAIKNKGYLKGHIHWRHPTDMCQHFGDRDGEEKLPSNMKKHLMEWKKSGALISWLILVLHSTWQTVSLVRGRVRSNVGHFWEKRRTAISAAVRVVITDFGHSKSKWLLLFPLYLVC